MWIHARSLQEKGLPNTAAPQAVQQHHSQTMANLSGIKRRKKHCYCSLDHKNSQRNLGSLVTNPDLASFFFWLCRCCPISTIQRLSGGFVFIWNCSKRSYDQRRAPPSSLGLLLVPPAVSTPNKVSQRRARSPAERLRLHSVPTDVLSLIHLSSCRRSPTPHTSH